MSTSSYESSWWPPLLALAAVPSLISLGIVATALGGSDALVVAVVVGPLVLVGLCALVVALGAIAYLPYARWKDSRLRKARHRTPADSAEDVLQQPRVAPASNGS